MVEKMRPFIGVGVLVLKDNKILLGERVNAHGSGTWCPPGGHLEFGETPQECGMRELQEETGLIAKHISPGPWTNDLFQDEKKHYVTLYMIVTKFEGSPSCKEPHKCLQWKWFDYNRLPSNLFLSFENFIHTPEALTKIQMRAFGSFDRS
ncbi:MAG: NUDIX hydrolase [Chlamydiales bacterium]